MDFLFQLFDGSDFPARWHCGKWTLAHGYLHIFSDVGIFLAYIAIPLLLSSTLRRVRRKLSPPVPTLVVLFSAFILFCGMTHLTEAIIFYHPVYRFAGLLKFGTALVSWATVLALAPALPRILALKSPKEMQREVEQATQALRQESEGKAAAELLLTNVIDASPSGMLATDASGTIVLVNCEAARLFGYAKEELIGNSIEVLVPTAERERHPRLREAFSRNPSARKMGGVGALLGQRKDGNTFPLEVGLNPIVTPQGLLTLSAIVDRSEMVERQRELMTKHIELERSNVELEGFASAASHDLKAPLRAIQNAVQWIEEDIDPVALTGEVRENFELLKGRAARMESLLNALLDYARAGRSDKAVERVDPREVVESIVELLGPEAERAVVIENELPAVRTTRVLMEQVFSNLISNSLKHGSRDNLRILVRGYIDGQNCVYEVEDNGPGIEPRFHDRIFQVFQTLRPRDEVEGAGMGLALVKKVVEGEGGAVGVRSDLGKGATFVVRWPRGEQ